MKNIRIFLMVVLTVLSTSAFAQNIKKDTIKVLGNCNTCKKNIEKAALVSGAINALWNKDSKVLTVTYNTSQSSNDAIQKKIASVGYDTEKYNGDDDAYNKLDACCQYERKKENQ